MKSNWHRALLASLLMIFSGLAGCLEADSIVEESSEDNGSEIVSDTTNNTTGNVTVIPDYGTIMTSTYHVAQLVSAIVGPTATVEMMSTSNIPVHDYKPSIQDTVRLANSDVFFYHGLNLEPWVEGTLSTLGSDAPPAYAVHTMPTGEVTPDYQSLLVSDLCEQLAEGDRESNTLIAYENLASQLEIHLEKGVQSLTFPGADAAYLQGHDHDDHDEHDEEHHGLAILFPDNTNMTFEMDHDDLPENASGWNLTTMVMDTNSISYNSTFDAQYGNYVTEIGGFEAPSDGSWWWTLYVWNETGETWDMSNMGIDSVMIEEVEHIAFAPSTSDVSLIPVAEDDHDDHEDHTGHDDHDDHGDHDEHAHAEPEKVIENPTGCPSDTVIAVFHLEEGVHIVEFETNSTDITNFEVAALPMLGGHAHHDHGHGDHGDEHDDHSGHDDSGEEGHDGHDNHTDDDHGDEGHDDHDEHDDHVEYPICHNAESHENMEGTNQSDCETAGNLWMEGAPNDGTLGFLTIHVENEGDYGFALPSYITAHILMGEGGHDDHAGHDDHDDHSGHDDHDDHSGHDDHDDHGDEESEIIADDDEEEFEYDPHSWLDPVAFKSQANLVLNALIEQFPEGNETFTANAQQFMLELDRIHLGYSNTFGESSTCTTNTVAANHNAYSYLTVRYGIEFVTIHGLDPEGEPSVADITKVIEKINEDEITVLYIEEYTLRSAVDSIVASTGVEVLYLYTMEMSPTDESDSYLTMMNKNLENLKTGMGCTA